ncbi:MAG: SprT family zinc-dependent metalloprotease [Pseudomonadota bacterium]
MPQAEAICKIMLHHLLLDGQEVVCRLVCSKTAKKLRIKVKPDGVEVVVPEGRDAQEGIAFVTKNQAWVAAQLERARQLRSVRRPDVRMQGQVLFRGELVSIKVVLNDKWLAPNRVALEDGGISITCGSDARTPTSRSLENWLRKQARESIEKHLADVGKRVKRTPNRVYVMGQRTKWGNCSALGNLSFNWRLIMAPDYVLRYIVTHEMTHLAIPDHSQRFWMTVQSICQNADHARQWLVRNADNIKIDLSFVIGNDQDKQ